MLTQVLVKKICTKVSANLHWRAKMAYRLKHKEIGKIYHNENLRNSRIFGSNFL